MNLNSYFRQIVLESQKHILSQFIEEKLRDYGIENDEPLVCAIAEHILSGSEGSYKWDDEKYGDVKLIFTNEDIEEILQRLKSFSKNELPTALEAAVTESAGIVVKELDNNWPEQKIFERHDLQVFRDRLELRWHKGLDPLRMLLTCAREISEKFETAFMKSKAKRGIICREVLILLHKRACQTTMEAITLLENGLADGALARWRTLYEIWVIAALIEKHGDDIAQRYLDHDAVAMKRYMDNELKYHNNASKPPISKKIQMEINRDFKTVVDKYGKRFSSNYGWASYHLAQKDPKFQMLEEAIQQNSLPPTYKWASLKVHAGVAGLVRSLGDLTGEHVTLIGASNAGLEEPTINTAITLTQITSLLYGKSRKIENMIELAVLCILCDRVQVECTKATRKLEKDESKLVDD
ncbi:MAG: DUF5677 domain-containing protein [Gammaproteobacteria bacterium]|nr:DUF5677 domain-containing protein [Gammaproteobacteria bacterium]